MYRLQKYEIHNWVTDTGGIFTYRNIIYKKDNQVILRDRLMICYTDDDLFELWFTGNKTFQKEYSLIFNNEIIFHSLDSAKERVDLFLKHLSKLICFI